MEVLESLPSVGNMNKLASGGTSSKSPRAVDSAAQQPFETKIIKIEFQV